MSGKEEMKKQLSEQEAQEPSARVVSLWKTHHRDPAQFVRLAERLAGPAGDIAAFLDEGGATLAGAGKAIAAILLWKRAGALYEAQGRSMEEAQLYANLGAVLATAGDLPGGIDASKKAQALAEQFPADAELLRHLSSDLGAMYNEKGDWEAAMYEESRALEISREMGDCAGQVDALLALAEISIVRGDLPSGRSEAMNALTLAHGDANILLEASCLGTLGDLSSAEGQYAQAIREYRQALAADAVQEDPDLCGRLHFSLSVAYDAVGDDDAAAEQRNLAESTSEEEDADN